MGYELGKYIAGVIIAAALVGAVLAMLFALGGWALFTHVSVTFR